MTFARRSLTALIIAAGTYTFTAYAAEQNPAVTADQPQAAAATTATLAPATSTDAVKPAAKQVADSTAKKHGSHKKAAKTAAVVDINSADAKTIGSLRAIGPKAAKAIVDYRTKNGPFATSEDLAKVPGIGKKKAAHIIKENGSHIVAKAADTTVDTKSDATTAPLSE